MFKFEKFECLCLKFQCSNLCLFNCSTFLLPCKMDEDACKSCGYLTKYRCLTCHNFVCNMSLECSIIARETHPGWKAGKVLLYASCAIKKNMF